MSYKSKSQSKRNKQSRRKNSSRSRSNKRRTLKGGSCNCPNCGYGGLVGGISGGVSGSIPNIPNRVTGGAAFFEPTFKDVPIRSFYPHNDYKVDPVGDQHSARLDPMINSAAPKVGGSYKRKEKKSKKYNKYNKYNKSKKMKGGFVSFPYTTIKGLTDPLVNGTTNMILSSGNTSGSLMGANVINADPINSYNPAQLKYNGDVLV